MTHCNCHEVKCPQININIYDYCQIDFMEMPRLMDKKLEIDLPHLSMVIDLCMAL